MSKDFDPYYQWLGIKPKDQPPNHYRLLGIDLFEDDRGVIETAADRQMMLLRTFQSGKNGELSQKLLNEVSAAKVCLLNLDRKQTYDSRLKGKLERDEKPKRVAEKPEPPVATPPPKPLPQATPVAESVDVELVGLKPLPEVNRPTLPATVTLPKRPAGVNRDTTTKILRWAVVGAACVVFALVGLAVYEPVKDWLFPPVMSMTVDIQAYSTAIGTGPVPTTNNPPKIVVNPESVVELEIEPPVEAPAVEVVVVSVEPVEAPPVDMGVVDLLALIDPVKHSTGGGWRRDGDAIVGPTVASDVLRIPYELPDEYDLTMVVARTGGKWTSNDLSITGGPHQFTYHFNTTFPNTKNRKRGSALKFEGINWSKTPTTNAKGWLNKDGTPAEFVISVRKEGVGVMWNGEVIILWDEGYKRIAKPGSEEAPARLAFATLCGLRISKLELTPYQSLLPRAE